MTDNTPKRFRRNPSPLAGCINAAKGSVNAGVLLLQIQYRFEYEDTLTERNAQTWVAQTRGNWLEETGLTLSRYKAAVQQLEKLKLIEVRYWKYNKRDKWPMTFIRLLEKTTQSGLKVTTDSGQKNTKHCDAETVSLSGQITPLNKDNIEGKNEKEKVLPKAKNYSPNESYYNEGSSIYLTLNEIEELWRETFDGCYPNLTSTPFAGPDFNSAKILQTKLGDNEEVIIRVAVMMWDQFIEYVEEHSSAFKLGDIPNIHVLAKHAELALNWYNEMPHTGCIQK